MDKEMSLVVVNPEMGCPTTLRTISKWIKTLRQKWVSYGIRMW